MGNNNSFRWINCPNCDLSSYYPVEEGMQLLHCEPDEGGCDTYFVANVKLEPLVKTYTLEEVEDDV